jgi:hypothetical protein
MGLKPIDPRTGFHIGYHGTHAHAIEYMLEVMESDPADQVEFIKGWRDGALDEFPEYYEWLREQHGVEETL